MEFESQYGLLQNILNFYEREFELGLLQNMKQDCYFIVFYFNKVKYAFLYDLSEVYFHL